MKYRLICIFDKSSVDKEIDIEVCIDTGSHTLSPFQRKVTMAELLKSEGGTDNRLVQLLFELGQENQPFKLSSVQLAQSVVQNIINSQEWLYVHGGGKSKSLKRVPSLNLFFPKVGTSLCPDFGNLLGGELYIQNLQNWWNNIRVRFRYEDTSSLFPTRFSEVPFQSNSGRWLKRNKTEEEFLLQILGGYVDYSNSFLNLGDNVEKIKDFIQRGWSLFIPKDTKKVAKVTIKSDKTGIEWFAYSDSSSNSDIVEKILKAYLHNRNYVESNGDIQLFIPKTIEKLSPTNVTSALIGRLNVNKLYSSLQELDNHEKESIKRIINQKIKAILKPYQIEGVYWLTQMRKKGTGCLLADDMGLGKTLQVLAYLTTFSKLGIRHLVVCPASLTSNWENETMKFCPDMLQYLDIASYEAVRIHPEQYGSDYDTLIIDEGQMVKNDNTQRHQAVYNLNRKHTIILSGTPIENSIKEIWSQFQLLIPEITILEKKLLSLDVQGDSQRWCELSKVLLSPFILRRTKDEVLKSLPDITEKNIYLDLSPQERRIYQSVLGAFKMAIETGISGRINSIALEGLLRLRQCCVSVNLLPKQLTNSGYVKSTKMEFALNSIKHLIIEKHKILVFSQFTSALDELKKKLDNQMIANLYLSGSTRNRQNVVDAFQNEAKFSVFLISLKAGGTGLNLTAADRVIFLDDWWNPAVESQAFSRAHRIGQKNTVEIYRIICKNTIEEKIIELHKSKKEISDIFNRGDNKLTIEDIKNLLT